MLILKQPPRGNLHALQTLFQSHELKGLLKKIANSFILLELCKSYPFNLSLEQEFLSYVDTQFVLDHWHALPQFLSEELIYSISKSFPGEGKRKDYLEIHHQKIESFSSTSNIYHLQLFTRHTKVHFLLAHASAHIHYFKRC